MKNHKRFEELIQGYVDNDLSNEERRDLKNHLKTCKICAEKLKSREELLRKLRSTREEIQCPDYLIDNILRNTTQKETTEIISSYRIRWRYLAVSAAAVLIVVSTVLLNIENINRTPKVKGYKESRERESLEEVEISKKAEVTLDEEKKEKIREEKPLMKLSAEEVKVPKAPLPEKKVSFKAAEKLSEAPLTKDMSDVAEIKDYRAETSRVTKADKARGAIKIDMSRKSEVHPLESDSETEMVSFAGSESGFAGKEISEETFNETRFVFPEEGSVVGEDFEIVLILENPEDAIEISLDGEKITNYIKAQDSNVIFIGSDSMPPLEEGLHYLSFEAKEEKSITFYKEG